MSFNFCKDAKKIFKFNLILHQKKKNAKFLTLTNKTGIGWIGWIIGLVCPLKADVTGAQVQYTPLVAARLKNFFFFSSFLSSLGGVRWGIYILQ